MMRQRLADVLTMVSVVIAALVVGGCGGNETPAVCADVDALKTSIADLTDVEIDENALASLQEKFTQVRADLTALIADAEDEYDVEIDAVDQAVSEVGSSLEAAVASPSAVTVSAVAAALQALGTSLTALADAVKDTC